MKNDIETDRLKLRQWLPSDYAPFAALNADPDVMKYFPGTLSEAESNLLAQRCETEISENGWGLWAVERKSTGVFIGFVGLHRPATKLPFSPCVEIGWRLAKQYWGNGYATEAAQEALRYAFENLHLAEIVSFTSVINKQSQNVMKKIGMADTRKNFMHPSLPAGDRLQEHVLFKIVRSERD